MTVLVEAIASAIKGDPVGSGPAGENVFDTVAPGGIDMPYVTVQQLPSGVGPQRDQSGGSGLEYKRFQINVYESTAKLARVVRDAIVALLDGNIGGTIGNVPHSMTVLSFLMIDDFPDFIPATDATDVPAAYVHRMEFEGWHA